MYLLYDTTITGAATRYSSPSRTSLLGYKSGIIARMLVAGGAGAIPTAAEWKWHLPIADALATDSKALVIDLKPKEGRAGKASLYKLRNVWGFTADGWSPVMLRLQALAIDGNPHIADADDFTVSGDPWGSIYTFLFLRGSIRDGKLEGKWTGTSPSPTNSLLIFPRHMRYFTSIIRENDPDLLAAG